MTNQLSQSLPEQTFQYQNSLPPLPVPSLQSSLSKYLDAGRMSAVIKLVSFQAFVNICHVTFQLSVCPICLKLVCVIGAVCGFLLTSISDSGL